MLFNTLQFALFFAVVYILYLSFGHKWQNRLLLLATYVFYAYWDCRFLSLIAASTLFNYYLGIKIDRSQDTGRRRAYLAAAICLNLCMLGFFKYFNFFAYNIQSILWSIGLRPSRVTLNIVLPLGISFYTFQAMTYTIDINRGLVKPAKNILDFGLFVSFFPLLVAGPIERARNFLPQILAKRSVSLDKFYQAAWLVFFGLYKKIFIADNLARFTDTVLMGRNWSSGFEVLIASYAFAFQVYADFSGYSDMARGLCRAMGFEVMENFRAPFFSQNIYDLWQRWHISLTTWIKEYLYYPLALARFYGRQLAAPVVVVLTWAVMGFWHGAAWKFVVWGVYHGMILVIFSRIRPYLKVVRPQNSFVRVLMAAGKAFFVFNLFSTGLLFFALETVPQVLGAAAAIFFSFRPAAAINTGLLLGLAALILPLLAIEYFQYKRDDELVVLRWPAGLQAAVYYVFFYCVVLLGDFSAKQYYYFQF